MQVISKEFIHREEVNRVVAATKNTQAHTAPRGSGQTSHPRDNHRDNGSRGIPKPLRQKDLPSSLGKGVLPKARPLKGRTQNAKNRSLYFDCHQGYGHKTQDCCDLKDAIEQAIRDGKLNDFVQIIREPRTSERQRSPKSESRNPRSRRDSDEPIMEIVVITGSSALEKSKSALKKDLKVLATMQTPLHHFRRSHLEKKTLYTAWQIPMHQW
ncbi:hypothetical protein PIB30_078594 [Stylosanthes scabra]|uniref:Reverse transcriptase domain-containing protein n=1 Tax=Stylosanthes scabra TaxID=79078 RepID=A0ABU6RR45_9FABA|nr:hypothetical protein [Stylosanthes scabra]